MDGDPAHPILDRAHEYSVADLRYHVALDGGEPYVDLVLHKGAVVRRLRFWSPQQFAVEEGFPRPTGGMEILDVRGRRLEGLGVRVADFEGSHGVITFWARAVVDLDTLEDSGLGLTPDSAEARQLRLRRPEALGRPMSVDTTDPQRQRHHVAWGLRLALMAILLRGVTFVLFSFPFGPVWVMWGFVGLDAAAAVMAMVAVSHAAMAAHLGVRSRRVVLCWVVAIAAAVTGFIPLQVSVFIW